MTAPCWCAGLQARSGGRPATHRRTTRLRTCAALLLALVCSLSPLLAGGPRAVTGQGEPMVWDTSGAVVYHPDPGPLGLLSNAGARALLAEAFAEWAAGPSDISFVEGAPLGLNVNATGFPFTNPAHFQNFYRVHADGRSPVIFDHDGSIIETLFGIGARFEILGVASIDTPIGVPTTITGASIIINGAFYDGIGLPESPDDVTLAGLKAAMVHEIGHFINLDHSVLNHELALDDNPGNDIYVPSMFPLAVLDEAALADTNPDDELAAQNLYPAGLSDRFIYGTVSFSGVPFQGANVVIRKLSDPLMSAYSLVSGGRFFPCNPGSLCDPCNTVCDPGNPFEQGAFQADYFPTDDDYTVCVEQIDTRFAHSNDTFVGPLATPPIMPGPEECFDSEESFMQADDPDDSDPVTAGGPGLDIALNALPSSDPFEPNNTLGTGAPLADLPAGQDTAAGVLGAGDLDVFNVPVTAGQRVRIDIDAAELGSALDAVVGFYNGSNTLVALSDDAVDPDSQAFSTDPALELIAGFTGTGKVVVSSFPDLDQDGTGGGTTGGYWIRVQVTSDADADGTPDAVDICPADSGDDTDRDGVCFASDNCHSVGNPSQFELVRLNGTLVSGGDVSTSFLTQFRISPDGTRAVYVADQETDEVLELYSVPVGGGAATKLSGSMVAGGDIVSYKFSPDSSRVVFVADKEVNEKYELYSVPIGGGTVTKLNGTLVAGGSFRPTFGLDFTISPDSSRVSYVVDQDTDDFRELFIVSIGGGSSTKINAAIPGGDDVGTAPMFTPNSATVVYGSEGSSLELYSVPAAGGASTLLTTPVPNGGQAQISADGSRVVYRRFPTTAVYSVPIGGGSQTLLSGTLTPGGTIQEFQLSKDHSRVVYKADQDTDDVFELYSVPIGGGAVTKLNGALTPGGDVTSWLSDQHDSRVIYLADQLSDGTEEVFSVPVGGGASTRLSGPLVADGNVIEWWVAQDRVAFVADKETDGVFDLWSAPAAGGASPTKLSEPVPPGEGVSFISDISPDGSLVAYVDNVFDLYGVPIAGGAVTKWSAPAAVGGGIWWGSFSPDGTRIAYLSDQEAVGVAELYSVDPATGADTDSDGVLNGCDNCVDDANAGQDDTDGNGLGDACQTCALGADHDADEVCGGADNCPTMANTTQADSDGDGAGNACDSDDDNDGLADVVETDTGTFVSSGNTGTDPNDGDSDDDGTTDGDEVAAGTDPNGGADWQRLAPFGPGVAIVTDIDMVAAVAAGDMDGDGDADVLASSADRLSWYENDGASPPGFTEHLIVTGALNVPEVIAVDLDSDGDLDVLSSANGPLNWYKNDGASQPAFQEIAVGDSADSISAADLDRDGDLDVIAVHLSGNKLAWHENIGTLSFTEHVIDSIVGVPEVSVADLNNDGWMDVFVGGDFSVIWYENNAGAFIEHSVASDSGYSTVSAADVDRDGDQDILWANFWVENNGGGGSWTLRTVAMSSLIVHDPADLDADGDVDLLSGNSVRVGWYENVGSSPTAFIARTISDNTFSVSSVAVDLDGDGDLDAIAASPLDDTLVWYENRMIHRNADVTARNLIASGGGITATAAGDIDGDGDVDAMATHNQLDRITWYENDGASPPGWTARNITTTVNEITWAELADLDGDGDLDALAAFYDSNTVAWYENDGASPPAWTQRTITSTADGALHVTTADLDDDGDLDALVSSQLDTKIAWHRNEGGSPLSFTEMVISTATPYKRGLDVADMDQDGDLDVLAVNNSLGRIHWYENDGASPPGWTPAVLSSGVLSSPNFVSTADIDGDGDMDAFSGSYAGVPHLGWFENDGAVNPSWTHRALPASVVGWAGFATGDLDADGDVDLAATSTYTGQLVWMENDGGAFPAWTSHVTSGVFQVSALDTGDIDSDGDSDLLIGVVQSGWKVEWWENRGGQSTLATASTAPGGMADGATASLLRIDLTSNGRGGDSSAELATLALGVTDGSGAPLSNDEANALIERLSIYLDDGSGVFEEASDLHIATAQTLALSPHAIVFERGDPRVRVGPGETKRFFVVARTTADASAQSPNAFRLVHLTESSSSTRDAATSALLTMQFATDVSTATIAAADDVASPAVTSVYPANNAVDVSPSTSIVVYFNEDVDPATTAAGVALYVGGLKIPARVTVRGPVVSLDPDSSLEIETDYLVRVTSQVRDHSGNAALAFVSTFDTADTAETGDIEAGEIGESGGGATLAGSNVDDNSGFAVAALGDVNATAASSGIADLIIGAPYSDAGGMDAGRATLIFGSPGLQSNAGTVASLNYRTATAGDFIGETVARAGDLDGDTIQDFLIGAPRSDQAFADAGVVYLVFGDAGLDEIAGGTLDLDDLATCATPTLCGVKFLGAAADDLAGASISWAGDVNGDGNDDLLIGAPGASPGGRLHAGRVYLIFGPLAAGTISLSQIGIAAPGLVLNGETAGDNFGAAVSAWPDDTGDGFDDLLIGAPGATALNAFGVPILDAGYIYAIHGGRNPGHLVDTATPGVIEMSRVASGGADQVAGMVFIGDRADGEIGRSLTGAVDTDGNGVYDILVAGNGIAFLIPGDGPKTITGTTPTTGSGGGGSLRAGLFSAVDDFGATLFVTGDDPLTVGAAGDINNDGYDDFIIGSPLADGAAGIDSGKAYIVLGGPTPGGQVIPLAGVGNAIAGFIVEGAQAGDHLGASVGGGFDLNADGVDDGLAGAPFADTDPNTPANAGETYVISPVRPGEVVSLMLSQVGGMTRLEWSVTDLASSYNIYRGLISDLQVVGQVKTSDMEQLACDIPGDADADADQLPDYDDSDPPPPGDAIFYLVTARNFQGEGPLGPADAVPLLLNDLQCPVP